MSNKVSYIDIKNRACYFFDYIVNVEKFDTNNIKICDDQRFEICKN